MESLYAILECDDNASEDDIKKSYKRLALKYHPDKNKNNLDAATEKFKRLTEAYSVLSDPVQKQEYDEMRSLPPGFGLGVAGGATFTHFPDINDLIGNIFQQSRGGGMPFFVHTPSQHPNTARHHQQAPLTVTVELNMAELRHGARHKQIDFQVEDCCIECSGTGTTNIKEVIKCMRCNGRGSMLQQLGPVLINTGPCIACNGQGSLPNPAYTCKGCHGKKVCSVQKSVVVALPAGIPDGHKHVLRQKGSFNIHSGTLSDVVLMFKHVLPASVHQVDSNTGDVLTNVKISLGEMLCGFHRVVNLYGEDIPIVSTGYTTPEKTIRVQGKGVRSFNDPNGTFGCLSVRVCVDFPDSEPKLDKIADILRKLFKIVLPSSIASADGIV